ncbi:MAG TPA: hypothetical protein PK156_22845 [Polyangium sp.]|nr:hypothetical protein [Polyangium sp.]
MFDLGFGTNAASFEASAHGTASVAGTLAKYSGRAFVGEFEQRGQRFLFDTKWGIEKDEAGFGGFAETSCPKCIRYRK